MTAARKILRDVSGPAERLDRRDWAPITEALHACGFALVPGAMTAKGFLGVATLGIILHDAA